jgi:hypothetical protein
MESQLAGLAAGVALVHKELDAIDEAIRDELLTCAALQKQLDAAGEELQRGVQRSEALEKEAAEKEAEEEDLQLLVQELQRQMVALEAQKVELEVSEIFWETITRSGASGKDARARLS